jgi:hypothetical protein
MAALLAAFSTALRPENRPIDATLNALDDNRCPRQ